MENEGNVLKRKATREELIKAVQRIMNLDIADEDELFALEKFVEDNVPHPTVSDLYYKSLRGNVGDTAEAIVDAALAYKATPLPALPPIEDDHKDPQRT